MGTIPKVPMGQPDPTEATGIDQFDSLLGMDTKAHMFMFLGKYDRHFIKTKRKEAGPESALGDAIGSVRESADKQQALLK